jgi:CheY-like chemotaxis protein
MSNISPKLLIVDDTPANVDLLRTILSPLGYKISFAYEGERALKIVPHFMPDLILMDVNIRANALKFSGNTGIHVSCC